MSPVTRSQKIFYAAVWGLAAWVGLWGYFIPARIDFVIPWAVPPMHARFIGAVYLSGAVAMTGALLAREWSTIRVIVPMVGIWTGGLMIFSLFYLGEFDFLDLQTWIWFVAYVAYPLLAFWYAWQLRGDTAHPPGRPISPLLRRFLIGQGVVLIVIAILLFVATGLVVQVWPWAITPLLAQLYGSPLLAYGFGSLYAARQSTYPEIRLVILAIGAFALAVLIASFIHLALFSISDVSDWIWFAALVAITGMLGAAAISDFRQRKSDAIPAAE